MADSHFARHLLETLNGPPAEIDPAAQARQCDERAREHVKDARAALLAGDQEEVLREDELVVRAREAAVWFLKFSAPADLSREELQLFARWILQHPDNAAAFVRAGGTLRRYQP